MAELEVGKHCEFQSCKQLDFLPLKCHGCSGTFCKEHSPVVCHDCSQCNIQQPSKDYNGPKSYTCFASDCNNKEVVPVTCEHCHNNFCLSHRHQQEHNCPLLAAEHAESKTSQHVKKLLESKQPAARKKVGAKSKQTAAKVALMKMKMKTTVDKNIPETERFYLMVLAPTQSSTRSKPMMLSKKWSMGKIIDRVAGSLQVPNNNNVQDAKKLRLFDSDDGHLICSDLEKTLEQLETEKCVFSGGTVILEYVDDGCSQICDAESYSV